MSIRAFADAMQARKPRPPGSARTMIHRYLKDGGPEPPTGFIRAAADILGVSPAWLAWEEGPRTHAEEAVRGNREQLSRELERAMTPVLLIGRDSTGIVRDTFLSTLTRLAEFAKPKGREMSDKEMSGLARRLSQFLVHGVYKHVIGKNLGPSSAGISVRRAREAYLAMMQAILIGIPDRPQEEDNDA